MRAIILAAGRGSRMQNLTDEQPKCLVQLQGKSLLEYQLDAIREAGINEIAIVTGYKRELLSTYGLVEFYNPRWAETNMVSSLVCAKDWLQYEPCLVSYSDIFYGSSAIKSLMNCNASLAVTYDPNWLELWTHRFGDPLIDAETFRLTSKNNLAEIGNKPKSVKEIQGQYMGLLRFTPRGWAEIERILVQLSPEEFNKIHLTATLQRVIKQSRIDILAIPYFDIWGEVDSEDDLNLYQES